MSGQASPSTTAPVLPRARRAAAPRPGPQYGLGKGAGGSPRRGWGSGETSMAFCRSRQPLPRRSGPHSPSGLVAECLPARWFCLPACLQAPPAATAARPPTGVPAAPS